MGYKTTPISGPSNGTIVINPNGTYVYTPTPGTTGDDIVVFEVCDSGTPIACSRATLYVQNTAGR
ncbi:MAG: hypothetical protein HC803_09295 [Saprospiraceae bacterium]|nr:hypothetical protein [Saprospiraceae bacterium]